MKKKKRRKENPSGLHGNAWTLPSAQVARSVYEKILSRFLLGRPEDWTLVSGYFSERPGLAFLWESSLDPELVKKVIEVIVLAGGAEMKGEAKDTLLMEIRGRRKMVLDRSPGDTVVMRHPKGKVWWEE